MRRVYAVKSALQQTQSAIAEPVLPPLVMLKT
jgi:hypothetical protein